MAVKSIKKVKGMYKN